MTATSRARAGRCRVRLEIVGGRLEQPVQRLELLDQCAGGGEHVVPGLARAEQQGDQFVVGQRRRPALQQSLAWPLGPPAAQAVLAPVDRDDAAGRIGRQIGAVAAFDWRQGWAG